MGILEGSNVTKLVDEIYDHWEEQKFPKKPFINAIREEGFSEAHQVAYGFFVLNSQVSNGGFEQWVENEYSEDIDNILNFYLDLKLLKYEYLLKLQKILETFYNKMSHRFEDDAEVVCPFCGSTHVAREAMYDYCSSCKNTGAFNGPEKDIEFWECLEELDEQYFALGDRVCIEMEIYVNELKTYHESVERSC